MDELLAEAGRNFCNVEFLFDFSGDGDVHYGVRLRPYGRRAPRDKMVLGAGWTAEEALAQAVGKAKAGRWEKLDWALRPWGTEEAANGAGWYA